MLCVLWESRSLAKVVTTPIFSIHLQIFDEVNMQTHYFLCSSSLCFCIIFDHEMVGGTFMHEVLIHIHQVQLLQEWLKLKDVCYVQCPKFLFEEQCCVT